MKTRHLMQRITIVLQAISSLHRNPLCKSDNLHIFNMNVNRKNVTPLCNTLLLTFKNILSAFVKCWTSVILSLPISHDKRQTVKVYK